MGQAQEAEYAVLRATIRERGSVRMWLICGGIAIWGALALALAGLEVQGSVTLVPFLVLAATFEVSFFIHTGVERVGRYLQVFYDDGWEQTIMAYGKAYPGGADPLFVTLFSIITAVNFLASFAVATRRPGWLVISFIAHLALGWRFIVARRLSGSQRLLDLERFRALKNAPTSN